MRTLILLLCLVGYTLSGQKAKNVSHIIYAVGNIGCENYNNEVLRELGNLSRSSDSTTILFLGNNVSISDFNQSNGETKKKLDNQLSYFKGNKGNIFFIPGPLDWAAGVKGLEKERHYISAGLDKNDVFLLKDGCPLKKVVLDRATDLLLVDSNWILADWDKLPNINEECEIKSKTAFYTEIEDEIVKSQNKTVLIALCHPPMAVGKYNNFLSFGISPQEISNKYYKDFSNKLLTIAQRFKNVVFVAGHETNLQYIIERQIPIIISGSINLENKANKGLGLQFSSDNPGFAKITTYTDESIELAFYSVTNKFISPIFKTEVVAAGSQSVSEEYNEKHTPAYIYKSVYEPKELKHSNLYSFFWGKHYREDYITPIRAKVALLDTLYGGLEVLRKGGGHQTNSLRLEGRYGNEFNLRSVKKSSLRFIQYFLFKTQYLDPVWGDTYFVNLLKDYWTTANPFAPLTIATLSDAIGIYHANPELYYIPKQKALGNYNDEYGENLYYIEEQISNKLAEVKSFGNHNKIIGTSKLIQNLQRKDRAYVDQSLYIRTRLFDNILGDFDRHSEQWRWAEDKYNDSTFIYSPIPRDRDQAFSDFDGPIFGLIRALVPSMRFMQRYNGKYKQIRWFNDAGDDLDRMVLRNDKEEDWVREAIYIKEHLTKDVVEDALNKIPEGVNTKKKEEIKSSLFQRIEGIEQHSRNLYNYLKSFVIITGTEKGDWFVITRQPDGVTVIKGYRINDGKKTTLFWDTEYNSKVTKEIWLYGLDSEDIFEVVGEGQSLIPIKIIGGKNNDTYRFSNARKIHVYDQKSEPNTFETKVNKYLTDNYEINNYDFMKGRRDVYTILPSISYNPDDGITFGGALRYIKNDLVRNPFTAQHNLSAFYYTATGGGRIEYEGEFARVLGNLNLGFNAGFSTANYTNNFFGLGNNTVNNSDMEYNRVIMSQRWISPSLLYKGYYGSKIYTAIKYEYIDVENTPGRYINLADIDADLFNGQEFYSITAGYSYSNFDDFSFPQKGVGLGVITGYSVNFSKNKKYAFIIPELRLTSRVNKKGSLVVATKIKANYIFNSDFEFFQAVNLGQNEGLRGFRNQRFSGKSFIYQSTDLRLSLGSLRNGILPLSFGLYAGFDYGRVWVDNEFSNKWHTSQGGGIFVNVAGLSTANVAYFNSSDGGRLNIRLDFSF
ncbi:MULTISPECIES: hypothetical protein [Chryseobacterium]|uniref:Haemolysin activator HlyB C-terminal domain-containing protein n=1 Tax=Chryseobacterium wanjuense TaxID=356305 RepID=A0A1I0QZY7_9FLAO|nr:MULTISPECIES: hypothetical protein [Chryseobacterium]SEW33319.1 hypothetical protein SAMN05421841_2390 [Chryseobacterium wanjuense]